ncbi:hypothetical protein TNIN_47301 [Trichonephila inaurata madagascariensis]|uniref:Uncharacterized protein n=1 Tax=Trichonephila inaurata madagascariensis TaxID=2747483 RepID=A0A8X6YBU3_9ARAC|nr:hypothetical protein TNIN_47301 [Trichonephila inaurata madagascariensis]
MEIAKQTLPRHQGATLVKETRGRSEPGAKHGGHRRLEDPPLPVHPSLDLLGLKKKTNSRKASADPQVQCSPLGIVLRGRKRLTRKQKLLYVKENGLTTGSA